MPFNARAQGTIERFNYTIKKYLSKEFIANGNNPIDFQKVKSKIINYYNNKYHRFIGMSPNEAYKITNLDEIKKINDIKIKEYEKINNKRNYLEKNDTCLLNPKLLKLGKKTLIPNKVKKGKISEKIPVKVLKKASFGYYVIKISLDYSNKNIKLRTGEEYIADCVLLKKINSETWQAIASQKDNNKNLDKKEKILNNDNKVKKDKKFKKSKKDNKDKKKIKKRKK